MTDYLISRQAAIDALKRAEALTRAFGYHNVIETIRELPSVQPEIIRCKDCKYYVIHTFFGGSQGWCERLCDAFDRSRLMATELDDYCSRAEPYKEGDAK